MYGGSDERDVYRECQCRYSRGEGEVGWFRLLGHVICAFCINFELDLEHPCRCVGVFDQECFCCVIGGRSVRWERDLYGYYFAIFPWDGSGSTLVEYY